MKYEKLGKKASICMYVKTVIGFVITAICVLSVYFIIREELPDFVSWFVYGFLGIYLLYVLIAPKLRYERYRYRLTEDGIEVRKGLIVIKTEIVPIERLHKIEVSSGPIFRAFKLKEVMVTTAGGELRIAYLNENVAEQISEHLKKRINAIVVEEREAAHGAE
ncbi:MAG: PH domain-containing protein [Eubacteriales bacterium]|nr:PH domain-containing protein [Eubacteriales bacterium]